MTDWVQNLSLAGLIVVVVAVTFLSSLAVYVVVMRLAVGNRREAFKALSPGMLPPLGLLFGLLVGFLAAQVWSDAGSAQAAVNHLRPAWACSSAATSSMRPRGSGRRWHTAGRR